MRNPIAARLAADVAWVHSSVIRITEDLDEDIILRRAGPRAPSIAFHLWHTARWADVVQAHLPGASPELERLGPGEEVWDSRAIAAAWGMAMALGWKGAGTGLDDDESAGLALPDRAALVSYARSAFGAAEAMLGAIRDDELQISTSNVFDDPPWPLVRHFTFHLGHASRHLGMMEALRGVLGRKGTATI
jgi:hypothetical protein